MKRPPADIVRAAAYYRGAAERARADAEAYAERAAQAPEDWTTSTGHRCTPRANLCHASVASDMRAAELDGLAHGLEQKYGLA